MLRTLLSRPAAAAAAVVTSAAAWASTTTTACAAPPGAGSLSPDAWTPFTLLKKTRESHDTVRLTYALADARSPAALPVASCLMARLPVGEGGKWVQKPYTPVDSPGATGELTLVVKAYPEGKLSPALAALEPGSVTELKGPFPKIAYEANKWAHVGLVAGGTGITPMLQILHAGLGDAKDTTKFTRVYGNRSPADVICREEVERLASAHPARLTVHYLVDAPTPGHPGIVPGKANVRVGRPDKALLSQFLPAPGPGVLVAVCGPGPMMTAVIGNKKKVEGGPPEQGDITGALGALGFTNETAFKF